MAQNEALQRLSAQKRTSPNARLKRVGEEHPVPQTMKRASPNADRLRLNLADLGGTTGPFKAGSNGPLFNDASPSSAGGPRDSSIFARAVQR
jgi:hypothetical protein